MQVSHRTQDIWKAVAALILVSIIPRVIALLVCHDVTTNDSFDYANQAAQLANLDFSHYKGYYPPAYPLILLGCRMNWTAVSIAQSVMGIATSILLFGIMYRRTKSLKWAFAAGFVNSLSFNQLLFEHLILTETMARFLMVATFWQFQSIMERAAETHSMRSFVLLGVLVALTFLTRVNLLPMVLVFLMAFILDRRINRPPSRLTAAIIAFTLPVIVAVVGLCSFNKITIGNFTPSTALGWSLVESHSQMIKWAPDEYADFRDAYVKILGDSGKTDYGEQTWQAYGKVQEATGISIPTMSKRLVAMSVRIFLDHPKEYLESVAFGWYQFFQPLSEWHSTLCRCTNEFVLEALKLFGRLQAVVNSVVTTIFLTACLSALVAFGTAVRRTGQWSICIQQAAVAVVLLQSVCTAMTSTVDCPRFAIPVQPLIVLVALCFCWQIVCYLGRGSDKTSATL